MLTNRILPELFKVSRTSRSKHRRMHTLGQVLKFECWCGWVELGQKTLANISQHLSRAQASLVKLNLLFGSLWGGWVRYFIYFTANYTLGCPPFNINLHLLLLLGEGTTQAIPTKPLFHPFSGWYLFKSPGTSAVVLRRNGSWGLGCTGGNPGLYERWTMSFP